VQPLRGCSAWGRCFTTPAHVEHGHLAYQSALRSDFDSLGAQLLVSELEPIGVPIRPGILALRALGFGRMKYGWLALKTTPDLLPMASAFVV